MSASSSTCVQPQHILAIDIGGTKVAAGIVVLGGPVNLGSTATLNTNLGLSGFDSGRNEPRPPTIQLSRSIPTNAHRGGQAVCDAIVEFAAGLRREYDQLPGTAPLRGIAVASAGVIDEQTGAIRSATDTMPTWGGVQLGQALAQSLGLRVHVLNDVHAHALGEVSHGAGRGYKSALVIAVGTGIGGAIVDEGHVCRGAHGLSGHLGHIHHSLAREFPCSCGRYGHVESIASGTGIADLYNARAKNIPGAVAVRGGRALQDLAEAGNELAQQTFADSGRALGEVLGSLTNATDPEAVILSGSMTRSGGIWWEALREGFHNSAMNPVAETPILSGSLGGSAPLIGAATNFLLAQEAVTSIRHQKNYL